MWSQSLGVVQGGRGVLMTWHREVLVVMEQGSGSQLRWSLHRPARVIKQCSTSHLAPIHLLGLGVVL